jgi:ADP-ribose pyrophosphatase YjhB (NUDIX family)
MRLRSFCGFCGGPLGPLVGSRQDCAACGEPHYHDAKPCSAVLVLDDAGRVLLGRRAIEPARGLWDIPGGFCGPDETPEDCARRELLEETGCAVELTGFLGHVIDVYGEGGDHTLNALYTARIATGVPTAADDVAELRWFAPDQLPGEAELAFANTAEALRRLVGR